MTSVYIDHDSSSKIHSRPPNTTSRTNPPPTPTPGSTTAVKREEKDETSDFSEDEDADVFEVVKLARLRTRCQPCRSPCTSAASHISSQ